jgi:hypothetical protein
MVNGNLQSHDPFAVDEARWLEALDREWGRVFLISVNDGKWYANRLNGAGDAITAGTPGELAGAMGAAWHAGSVR